MSFRLKTIYNEQIVPLLMQKFVYANIDQVPKLEKIVVKCCVTELAQNAKGMEVAMNDLALITGQKPNKTGQIAVKARARHSMANYRMHDGQRLGLIVTLRGNVMYSFLDRLINLGLPRTFDLQGVTPSSFDGHGNYRIRIHEQSMFPEDRYDAIGKLKGVNVSITTSAKTNEETQNLLAFVGMPFGDNTSMEEEVEESLS
ncbi:large ribosomal subunit protein uL5c-like [Euphorbia lathyris]|uniref:large ribosomal subunit protein uL5c-like n=1 Tax=Euphorbia lathyris TaxID=212925 RepID=UPI003313E302